ncbi:ATP synthase subunit I [Methylomonas sp. UP202]|nr:ATP synthase subunit I [Methylomonas sp. UP202]WGS86073.1 ATP synthase subunit I [Methylomonas sp. UP202]
MAVGNTFSTVGKVLLGQVLMAALVASGFLLMGAWKSALSALLGGLVALIPNLYFAYRLHLVRHGGARKVVNAFYSGETIKLALTAALFILALQIPAIDFLMLLLGYAAVLSVFWFALLT